MFNSLNRTNNYDIEILTNEVLYITYASTHTYSFKVLREQPQAFIENIVLHYDIVTEDYNEYLVQYHISAEEFVNLHSNELLQSSENVTIIDLESGFFDSNTQAKGCNRVCETIFVNCSSNVHHSGNVGSWGSCTAGNQPRGSFPSAYQSCSTVCELDNAITAPPSDPSSGDTGGGGGNTTVVSNPLPTEPCDTNSNGGIGITNSNGNCLTVNPTDTIEECEKGNGIFNAPYSANSPFNVDLSLVRASCDDDIDLSQVETNAKFMCIYNKLTASPKFKDLFIDTFGENKDLNAVFEIKDILPIATGQTQMPNGDSQITASTANPSTGEITGVNTKIRLRTDYVENGSSIDIARTILHECIHVFLKVKRLNQDLGSTLDNIDNNTLATLLSQYYDGTFASGQEEHELMFVKLIPTMKLILSQIRDSLLTPLEIATAETQSAFQNETTTNGLPNTSWSWDQFYYYRSLEGLGSTQAFQSEIIGNKVTNFFDYRVYAINNFNSPCND